MSARVILGIVAVALVLAWLPAEAGGQVRQRYPDGPSAGPHQGPYSSGAPGFPVYPGHRDYAFDRGFREGYEDGFDAARDRDRYDPHRERAYRQGDRGYDRRYGPREYYKQAFRAGFRAGYDRGYRDGGYRARDRWRWWR